MIRRDGISSSDPSSSGSTLVLDFQQRRRSRLRNVSGENRHSATFHPNFLFSWLWEPLMYKSAEIIKANLDIPLSFREANSSQRHPRHPKYSYNILIIIMLQWVPCWQPRLSDQNRKRIKVHTWFGICAAVWEGLRENRICVCRRWRLAWSSSSLSCHPNLQRTEDVDVISPAQFVSRLIRFPQQGASLASFTLQGLSDRTRLFCDHKKGVVNHFIPKRSKFPWYENWKVIVLGIEAIRSAPSSKSVIDFSLELNLEVVWRFIKKNKN